MRSRKVAPQRPGDVTIRLARIKELKRARSHRPPEVEGYLDERRAAVRGAERVRPQHRRHGTPKDAVTWQNHSLVVLQADPKIRPALGFARVPVCQQTFVVFKFVEIELKHAGSSHLKEKGRRFRSGAVMRSFCLLFLFSRVRRGSECRRRGHRGGMSYRPPYLCYQRGAKCDGKGEPSCHPCCRFSRAAASPNGQNLPAPK